MKETKFDVFVEGLEEKRFLMRNEAINRELASSLRTKTREQVVYELFQGLTFIVGTKSLYTNEREKTLVF